VRKTTFREQKTSSPVWIVLFTILFLLFTASFSSFSQSASYTDDVRYHLPSQFILSLPIVVQDKKVEIPVIRYTARRAITKGAAIIIGDIQNNGNIDAKLLALAKTLPDWGWNTLFIMPQLDYLSKAPVEVTKDTKSTENQAPEENTVTENATTVETDDATNTASANSLGPIISEQVDVKPSYLQTPQIPYSKQDYINFINVLTAQIDSELTKGAGYQIIYAKGQSASAVIDLMSQKHEQFAHALVLNNPYWPNMESNQSLPNKLAKLSIPVLDLISLSDNIWAKSTVETRRVAAKVGLKSLYRQQEVFAEQTLDTQHNHLSKALVNWTHFLGW
jgi:hypothetical protein